MTTDLNNMVERFTPKIWLNIASSLLTKDLRELVQTTTKLHQILMKHKEVWMGALRKEGKDLTPYQALPLSTILHCLKYRKTERQVYRMHFPRDSHR